MSTNKISKIRVKGIDYEVKDKKQSGVNTITSLTSIPNTKEQIIANLSGPTEFSLSAMEPGDSIEVTCIPSKDFKQSVTGDNIKTTFDGEIYTKQNSPFKIYVDCYENNNIFVDVDNKGELPSYFILVSTSSSQPQVIINRYTNQEGTNQEEIIITKELTNYKVDGLMYGFSIKIYLIAADSHPDIISNIDLTHLNTSNIKKMSGMFINCSGLTSLDVSNFDTSNVTDMSGMFSSCSGLTSLDVSNFDTSNVTNMGSMFINCSGLTSLDVSNFDTSNVTGMSGMFMGCNGLTSLDVSNFDTSNVTDMLQMFSSCSGLTSLDLSNFDTSKVTNMRRMFANCDKLTSLDVSNFDTSNVTNMVGMFDSCPKLNHIKCKQAFRDWCWSNPDDISLPTAMRSGGSGQWEIVP